MQFLWNLLPGAREARNDLIVGYTWLIAIGLCIGVPELGSGRARELADAVGPLGIAIAVSVIAFMLGSFSSDLVRLIPGFREARAFSTGWGDPVAVLENMSDKEIAELERLEGTIDRNTAEVTFRLSLLPPIVVAGIASAIDSSWWWGLGMGAVVVALFFQSGLRRMLSQNDISASRLIREQAANRAGAVAEDRQSF